MASANSITKKILMSMFGVFFLLSSLNGWAIETEKDGFWYDLFYRSYEYYIPAGLSGPAPMIIDLHGYSGSSKDSREANNGYLKVLADREGIIMVWPRAATFPTAWNGGPCCLPATNLNIDDRGYIEKVVKRMKERLNVDETRVYAIGVSNGGIMSHRLGLQSSDVFAAIAPVAFQITDNWTWSIPSSWYPDRSVPQIEIHAINDNFIFYWGGLRMGDFVVISDSAPEGLDTWGDINDCNGEPNRYDHEFAVGAYRDIYEDCSQNVKVQLLTTASGSHGDIYKLDKNGGINIHEEQWAFIDQFRKPGHKSDRMWEEQKLRKDQWLISPNGSIQMIFQNDGNLVLKNQHSGQVFWASGTANQSCDKLVMQGDGNLVIWRDGYWGWKRFFWCYHKPKAIWASNTNGSGEARLQVTDNGKLQLFHGNTLVWERG